MPKISKSITNLTKVKFLNKDFISRDGITYKLGLNVAAQRSYTTVQHCYDSSSTDNTGIIVAIIELCPDSIICAQPCGEYHTDKLKVIDFINISNFLDRIDIDLAIKILEFNVHMGAWMFSSKTIGSCIQQEIVEKCVNEFPHVFRYLPFIYKTKNICEMAVIKHPDLIRWMPENYKTAQICNYVIFKCPYLLFCVPDDYKTKDMCQYAVKNSFTAWRDVPNRLITQMCA